MLLLVVRMLASERSSSKRRCIKSSKAGATGKVDCLQNEGEDETGGGGRRDSCSKKEEGDADVPARHTSAPRMRLSPIDGWIIASIGLHEHSTARCQRCAGCRPRCWDCKVHTGWASGSPRLLRRLFFFVARCCFLVGGGSITSCRSLAARVCLRCATGPCTSVGCCITRLGPNALSRRDRPLVAPVQSGHAHLFARLVLLVSHLQDVIAPPGFAQ